MAPTATVYTADIDLADNDRQIYDTLKLTIAMHPSETDEYMITRLLAYCLEYQPGITFSKGLAEPTEPAIWARALDGQLTLWVEVGLPGAEKIHKASKTGARVAIYTHRDPKILFDQIQGEKIYRAEEIPVYTFSGSLISEVKLLLEKRMKINLSVNERELYLELGGQTLSATIERRPLVPRT